MGNMKETEFPEYIVRKPIDDVRSYLRNIKQFEALANTKPDKIRILDEHTFEMRDETIGWIRGTIHEISGNLFSLTPDLSSMMPNHAIHLKIYLSVNPDDAQKTNVKLSLEHDLPSMVVPLLKLSLKEAFEKFFSGLDQQL